jgi:hypothetical protein
MGTPLHSVDTDARVLGDVGEGKYTGLYCLVNKERQSQSQFPPRSRQPCGRTTFDDFNAAFGDAAVCSLGDVLSRSVLASMFVGKPFPHRPDITTRARDSGQRASALATEGTILFSRSLTIDVDVR